MPWLMVEAVSVSAATSPGNAWGSDGVAGNNSATDTDTIVSQADLSITKTDGATTVNAGANVTYTIVATNPASVAISNVGVKPDIVVHEAARPVGGQLPAIGGEDATLNAGVQSARRQVAKAQPPRTADLLGNGPGGR